MKKGLIAPSRLVSLKRIPDLDRVYEDGAGLHVGALVPLYRLLEEVVLPLYARPDDWVRIMKGAISRNASLFHSHRMMRRYAAEAYLE